MDLTGGTQQLTGLKNTHHYFTSGYPASWAGLVYRVTRHTRLVPQFIGGTQLLEFQLCFSLLIGGIQ